MAEAQAVEEFSEQVVVEPLVEVHFELDFAVEEHFELKMVDKELERVADKSPAVIAKVHFERIEWVVVVIVAEHIERVVSFDHQMKKALEHCKLYCNNSHSEGNYFDCIACTSNQKAYPILRKK